MNSPAVASKTLFPTRETEICVSIAGDLIDMIEDGKVTHSQIRDKLRDCVRMYGTGYTDDFFVSKVIFAFRF